MLRSALFLILIAFFLCTSAQAQIYKWTDSSGVVHFQDSPPSNLSSARKLATLPDTPYENGTGSGAATARANPAATTAKAAPSAPVKEAAYHEAKVEVYGTSWCPWCKKTLAYFRSRGIAVHDYDVEKDSAAARRKNEIDPRRGVPTVVVNGKVIHGYSPRAFASALKSSR